MKKQRIKLIVSSILFLVSAVLATGSVLAWFASFDSVDELSFKILQIDSEVRMYHANDLNYNGIPDLLDDENINKYFNDYKEENEMGEIINPSYHTYAEYTNAYYDEKYDFTLKDSKIALSNDSSVNQFNRITIEDMAPSKVYTYKFELINYAGSENNLGFGFDSLYKGNLETLSKFEARIGVINKVDGKNAAYDFTDWIPFTDGSSYNGIDLIEDTTIEAVNEYTHLSGRKDLWLQIRMVGSCENLTLSKYSLPDFRITFTFDYETA